MASVPTGMPAGICTIDSSESWPDSAFDSTGTPNTGKRRQRRGHARQMGRTARAGDDDLEAGRLGASREIVEPLGRAMRGDDAAFVAMPSAASVSAACRIVAQSDWLPMMMATSAARRTPSAGRELFRRTPPQAVWRGAVPGAGDDAADDAKPPNQAMNDAVFQLLHAVLQGQLLLLHALDLQRVAAGCDHRIDRGIEIRVFLLDLGKLETNLGLFLFRHARPSARVCEARAPAGRVPEASEPASAS
jgi:hypothetical protein